MPSLINGLALSDKVALDGLPRVALDDAGAQHVLYLPEGSPLPRSMLAADWTGAPLTEPTAGESAAAILARDEARSALSTKQAATRLRARGHVAVGANVDVLTNPQLLDLVRALAYRAGALDDDGVVLPLDEWTIPRSS